MRKTYESALNRSKRALKGIVEAHPFSSKEIKRLQKSFQENERIILWNKTTGGKK
jgi:hypothetical protein